MLCGIFKREDVEMAEKFDIILDLDKTERSASWLEAGRLEDVIRKGKEGDEEVKKAKEKLERMDKNRMIDLERQLKEK